MKPTISRDVHYVAYGTPGGEYAPGAHRAAKVTAVRDDIGENPLGICDLFVMNPTGVHFVFQVPNDEDGKQPGTWHWPEREEQR